MTAREPIAGGRMTTSARRHWPLHAAKTLQARDLAWPVQYERANIF